MPKYVSSSLLFQGSSIHILYTSNLSEAKFNEDANFEVRSTVAPHKARQIDGNKILDLNFLQNCFLGVEKEHAGNCLKCNLAKFRAHLSHVR